MLPHGRKIVIRKKGGKNQNKFLKKATTFKNKQTNKLLKHYCGIINGRGGSTFMDFMGYSYRQSYAPMNI